MLASSAAIPGPVFGGAAAAAFKLVAGSRTAAEDAGSMLCFARQQAGGICIYRHHQLTRSISSFHGADETALLLPFSCNSWNLTLNLDFVAGMWIEVMHSLQD